MTTKAELTQLLDTTKAELSSVQQQRNNIAQAYYQLQEQMRAEQQTRELLAKRLDQAFEIIYSLVLRKESAE